MFLNNIQGLPNVGNYLWVSFDHALEFENGRKFRIIIYGAKFAGITAPECNGIAILDNNREMVLCDEINKADTGYFGPTKIQICAYRKLFKMDWTTFCEFVNNHKRTRYQIGE